MSLLTELWNAKNDEGSLDSNKYATKKTFSQGFIDVAMLTTNIAQLKVLLQAGEAHEYYTLLLVALSITLVLQVFKGCCSIFVGSLNIGKSTDENKANMLGNSILVMNMLVMVINVIISVFDQDDSSTTTGK